MLVLSCYFRTPGMAVVSELTIWLSQSAVCTTPPPGIRRSNWQSRPAAPPPKLTSTASVVAEPGGGEFCSAPQPQPAFCP